MINIRSITYFISNNKDNKEYDMLPEISRKWAQQKWFIRTQRVAFPEFSQPIEREDILPILSVCDKSNIRWFNVPINPWESCNMDALFKSAQDVLKEYGRAFVNVVAVKEGMIDEGIIKNSANLIKNVSTLSHNGKDNFRLGLSFNIPNNGPFFPFTKSGGDFSFSIALELTQEINQICKSSDLNLIEFRKKVIDHLDLQISEIAQCAKEISKCYGIKFNGFDFSLAPIIDEDGSVIPILNYIGAYNFGKCGSMFATSYLTNILKEFAKRYDSVGFSGVMYSLLEDLELCSINNAQEISLEDFIMQSTMCGCGLDMVPVYENISDKEIESICLDVYAISTRLEKPLGVRLLPIPGCKKNEIKYSNLSDDADFVANTKVVRIDNNLIRKRVTPFSYL